MECTTRLIFSSALQIARQPRRGRQFAENLVGLKVENILGPDLGSSVSRARIVELDRATCSGPLFGIVFDEKPENRIAHRDFIQMVQPVILHWLAVHQRAVAAIEIPNLKAGRLAADQAMPPRNRRVADRQAVGGVAS